MLFALLLACAPSPGPLASTLATASTGTPAGTPGGTGTTFAAGPAVEVFVGVGTLTGENWCEVVQLDADEVMLSGSWVQAAAQNIPEASWRNDPITGNGNHIVERIDGAVGWEGSDPCDDIVVRVVSARY